MGIWWRNRSCPCYSVKRIEPGGSNFPTFPVFDGYAEHSYMHDLYICTVCRCSTARQQMQWNVQSAGARLLDSNAVECTAYIP